jgi:hypothetical protein
MPRRSGSSRWRRLSWWPPRRRGSGAHGHQQWQLSRRKPRENRAPVVRKAVER